jgi:fimbrial chaperone protein
LRTPKSIRFCAFLLASLVAAPAFAGQFSVTPVRIFMAPRDRATAITVTNEGDDELVMQADVYTWHQKPSGEDDLALSEDLILSPPILKLAPRSRQVVRLARVGAPSPDQQLTYRMVVREVPEARKDPGKDVRLQVALAFSLPVFITPSGLKRQLECEAQRSAADAVAVTCNNTGALYAQPRELTLSGAGGRRLAGKDSGFYILPGMKRTYELRDTDGPIPAGALKLALTFDDGSSQEYELKLPE